MKIVIAPLAHCLIASLLVIFPAVAQGPDETDQFRLYLLGHEIGRETDRLSIVAGGRRLEATFEYEDRGTPVRLTATLDADAGWAPRRFISKGQTYRYFSSDVDVTVEGARARVRDGSQVTDVEIGAKPFFALDTYAPIGVQEQLIRYWRGRRRPQEILSAPAGPLVISSRAEERVDLGGESVSLERLAITGPVWGRETAWVEPGGRLAALFTWAGGLPFEAIREGYQSRIERFRDEAIRDRLDDLQQLTEAVEPVQSDTFALVGATVVDGTRRAPIANATVIVRGGRIEAVGPASRVRPPSSVPKVDVAGATIIPGLWDMHAHASQIDWAPVYLASGVTTIRDMGGEMAFLTAFRDAVSAGEAIGPRMLLAGLIDGPGPRAFGAVSAATADEAQQIVRRYKDAGFRQIKIYSLVSPSVAAAIAVEAHRLGMTVTGHVPNGMTADQAVGVGFDQIAHMPLSGDPGSEQVQSLIGLFVRRRIVIDPTESWNELLGRPAATPIESFQPGVRRLPTPLARMIASLPGSAGDAAAARARLLNSLHLVRDASQAGVLVVAGSDKGVPGFSLQRELELYVEGGMTPLDALRTATANAAQAMRIDDSGTVEGGKRADLVVLTGNPLENISNIRTAKWVVANGKLYDCQKLWEAAGFK
jgi:imidazolonepropionase-like amidohydrolase